MKILDFILCDDIRKEVSNKHTLIGVYDDKMIFQVPNLGEDKWPKRIKLGLFIRVKLDEGKPLPNRFSIEFIHDRDKVFGRGEGEIIPPSINIINLLNFVLALEVFPITGVGVISFLMKFYKDDKIIDQLAPDYELNVEVQEHPTGNAIRN